MFEDIIKDLIEIRYALIIVVSENFKQEKEKFLEQYNKLKNKPKITTLQQKQLIFENDARLFFFQYAWRLIKTRAANKIFLIGFDENKHQDFLENIWHLTFPCIGCKIIKVKR